MNVATFDSTEVGYVLPEHIAGPVTRTVLALFAGASADHLPLHIDIDFARRFGQDDVFAHGMLSMAYLAQLLTRWVKQEQIARWNVRFVSITPVNATVLCSGTVIEKLPATRQVRVAIMAQVQGGAETLSGEALVALP